MGFLPRLLTSAGRETEGEESRDVMETCVISFGPHRLRGHAVRRDRRDHEHLQPDLQLQNTRRLPRIVCARRR